VSLKEDLNSEIQKSKLNKITELLERSGIPIDDIGSVSKVKISEWQGLTKDEDGTAQIHDLGGMSIAIHPKWHEGPAWPVVQQAQPINIKSFPKTKSVKTEFKTAVILPDPQIGFRLYEDGTLDPFHDEKAMNLALKLVRYLNPDVVVNLGDFLDFPEFGRFEQEPMFARTTQASIDRGYKFLCEQRANAPDAKIVLLEGNHDRRIQKSILKNAAAALHLKRAEAPEEWPVMSVPFLLRLDSIDVEYVDGYPAGIFYLNENLACVHGDKVRSNGSTTKAVVDSERISIIHGHIHRIEQTYITRRTFDGAKTWFAASPGCLCRTDGAVPSVKGSTDSFGRPINATENWQQGMAVVTYKEGNSKFQLEMVPIFNGETIFRGELFSADE